MSEPHEDLEPRGFRCPYCKSAAMPHTESKISTGGWIVFAALLLFCFPLCWIGFFIKDQIRVCSDCGMKLGA